MKREAPQVIGEESSSSFSESSGEEWEFIPSRRPLSLGIHRHMRLSIGSPVVDVCSRSVHEWYEEILDIKTRLGILLKKERFWERYKSKIVQRFDIVAAYGIGSFTNSKSSLFQLCFLLLMTDMLSWESKDVEFHEPQLSVLDLDILDKFSFNINPEKKRNHECVMCFMPHCDRVVYQEVIAELIQGKCEFTLISNLVSSYDLYSDEWAAVNQYLLEEPIYLFDRDYMKYQLLSEPNRSRSFKPRIAQNSDFVPFEAFNDLGIISPREDVSKRHHANFLEICSIWFPLDRYKTCEPLHTILREAQKFFEDEQVRGRRLPDCDLDAGWL